jgi:galactokinase
LNLKTAKLVITNSNVPHKLSSSQYNQRVSECNEAVKMLSTIKRGSSLRDFTLAEYEKVRTSMPETIRKRAFHVISENQRVLDAEKALKEGNLKKFGELMNQSHESLKLYYEVSSPELDWLTETARKIPGCYGSRMTGAGFGGCTVTLIEESAIPKYKESLKMYQSKFRYKAEIYESGVADGVHIVWKKGDSDDSSEISDDSGSQEGESTPEEMPNEEMPSEDTKQNPTEEQNNDEDQNS